jgi:hypothetical protein
MHSRKKKLTPLRVKFDEVAYGAVKEYARRNSLSQSLLSQVLSGKVTGENGGAASIEIFECLKRDGIYTEEFFPWQREFKDAKEQKAS